jgi:hypothetical protein
LFLSLRPGVSLAPGEDGELVFNSADVRIAVKRLAPGASAALQRRNSDLFARAAGADYYAETSVGEFLVGSKG